MSRYDLPRLPPYIRRYKSSTGKFRYKIEVPARTKMGGPADYARIVRDALQNLKAMEINAGLIDKGRS